MKKGVICCPGVVHNNNTVLTVIMTVLLFVSITISSIFISEAIAGDDSAVVGGKISRPFMVIYAEDVESGGRVLKSVEFGNDYVKIVEEGKTVAKYKDEDGSVGREIMGGLTSTEKDGKGRVAEMAVFGRIIRDTERKQLEGDLRKRWNAFAKSETKEGGEESIQVRDTEAPGSGGSSTTKDVTEVANENTAKGENTGSSGTGGNAAPTAEDKMDNGTGSGGYTVSGNNGGNTAGERNEPAPKTTVPEKSGEMTFDGKVGGGEMPSDGNGDNNGGSPGNKEPHNEIVSVRVENNTDVVQERGLITFGHVFKKGDLPSGVNLIGVREDGDSEFEVQLNNKVTNDDGSAHHAIITMRTPNLNPGQFADIVLSRKNEPVENRRIPVENILASGYEVEVLYTDRSVNDPVTYRVSARQLLQEGLDSHRLYAWIAGPLATEYVVHKFITPHIDVKFYIRVFADGSIRTIVGLENETSYTPGNVMFKRHDIVIKQDGDVVYSKNNIKLHHHGNYERVLWRGASPQLDLVFDVEYMKETAAIPQYDRSVGMKESAINSAYQNYMNSPHDEPMQDGLLEHWMPAPGGRFEIGPLNEWVASYLVSQDPRMKKVMDIVCDASGSIPIHLRDEETDFDNNGINEYVRVDIRPNLWIDERANYPENINQDTLPDAYIPGAGTPWTPDISHQPSLCYVPYLVSGDMHKLNELQAFASWTIGHNNPYYRDNENGLMWNGSPPQRSIAWFMRTVSTAAYISPDEDPMKEYFETILDNNFERGMYEYVNHNLADGFDFGTEYEGDTRYGETPTPHGWTMPWQDNYIKQVFSWIAHRDNEKAMRVLKWGSNFTTSLVLGEDANPFNALPAYRWYTFSADPQTLERTYVQTVKEANELSATYGEVDLNATEFPGSANAGWYVAFGRSVLSDMASLMLSKNGTEKEGMRALEALLFVAGHTPDMVSGGDYTYDTNAVNLTEVRVNDVAIPIVNHVSGNAGNDNINFHNDSSPRLLFGQEGDDYIEGGSGVDVIGGGTGNDTLKGGTGDDYIFGGEGDDRIMGGRGGDVLSGGKGNDIFVFHGNFGNQDKIYDFKRGEDLMDVEGSFEIEIEEDGVHLKFESGREIILLRLNSIGEEDFVQ